MLGVLHYFLILCFGIHQIASFEGLEGGCFVNMSIPNFPLMVSLNFPVPYYPKYHPDIANVTLNRTVEFNCPGSTVLLRGQDTGRPWIRGECTFPNKTSELHYQSNEITCSGPKSIFLQKSYMPCVTGGLTVRYQYALRRQTHVPILQVCFKRKRGVPIYAQHILRPKFYERTNSQVGLKSIVVDQDLYANDSDPLSVNLYKITVQRAKFNDLLFVYNESTAYIKDDFYLVPTFLSPVDDFSLEEMKEVPKRFTNVVSQWKIIQSHNWRKLEQEVRRCIDLFGYSVKVWTGTYGTVKVKVHGNVIPIFLHNRYGQGMYPVPGTIWKLLYSFHMKQAIVLIVFNNPYYKKIDLRPMCTDISSEAGWMLGWDKTNMTIGYSYACKYREFVKLVPYLPTLEVEDLFKCQRSD